MCRDPLNNDQQNVGRNQPELETTVDLVQRYQSGDQQAAEELFARYVDRLTRLARARLSPQLATRTDAEDIVFSAYRSFFVRARDGRFTLARSGELWKLLVSMTMHKLYRQARHHRAGRRAIQAEIAVNEDVLLGREPDPAEAIGVADI
ncbi:MAG: ECF-type sigma factor [Planctomycetota bacterium]|nr:ECF-type sigma factor [Planctomycetota bacterium]